MNSVTHADLDRQAGVNEIAIAEELELNEPRLAQSSAPPQRCI